MEDLSLSMKLENNLFLREYFAAHLMPSLALLYTDFFDSVDTSAFPPPAASYFAFYSGHVP